MLSRLSLAPRQNGEEDDRLSLHDGVSTETREITIVASPLRPVENPDEASATGTGSLPAVPDAGPHREEAAGPESTPVREPAPGRQSGWDRESSPNVGLDELLGGGSPRRSRDDVLAGTRNDTRNDRDAEQPERQPAKPKRSSVPSWDEIVFGARGD